MIQQQQQPQLLPPQQGGDPDRSSYLDLDTLAIVRTNFSIGLNLVPSEVNINIIQNPPTPPSALKIYSNDPDGLVGSFNRTNKSTARKIDNIIKGINESNIPNIDKQSKKEEDMLVITDNCTIAWIYHLNLHHVVQLNKIQDTYNCCVRKKVNTLSKVTSDIDYIVNYASDHIKRAYCIHVLKEEATNTSSLASILESTIASQALAPATV